MFGGGSLVPSSSGPQQINQPQTSPTGFSPYKAEDSALEAQSISSELWRLAQVFLHFPENKHYPFKHTFLNSSQTWSQNAGSQLNGYDYVEAVTQASKLPGGAGKFVPTEAIGFTGLNDRVSKQDLVVKRHTELVQEFLQLLEGRNQESKKVREMLSVAGQEQTILLQQLQKVFQKLDRSEQTIASEWHNGKFHRTDAGKVERAVLGLEEKVRGSSATGLMARATQLSRAANVNDGKTGEMCSTTSTDDIAVGDEYLDQVRTYLHEHQLGIKQMQDTLLKIQRDIDIMQTTKGT